VDVEVTALAIPDVKIIRPKKFADHRGFFSETYNSAALAKAGIELDFLQDNHSLSTERGVVRGLHFQTPPFAQDKLVRVVRGAIFDVAVDIRRGSSTFGKHVSAVVSAKEWNQILVPVGFAHGFCTLEPDTEVIYKVTNYYSPAHDKGLRWDDPALGIDWPISSDRAILSDKDRAQPLLMELDYFFT
jgi:dTDP-4-dehydrorhamnose 3,5-epimerase